MLLASKHSLPWHGQNSAASVPMLGRSHNQFINHGFQDIAYSWVPGHVTHAHIQHIHVHKPCHSEGGPSTPAVLVQTRNEILALEQLSGVDSTSVVACCYMGIHRAVISHYGTIDHQEPSRPIKTHQNPSSIKRLRNSPRMLSSVFYF